MVGELAMLVEHSLRLDGGGAGRVQCLKIPRAALHAQMLEDPSLAEQLERDHAMRLPSCSNWRTSCDASICCCTPAQRQ